VDGRYVNVPAASGTEPVPVAPDIDTFVEPDAGSTFGK
jgi:hypothetical protein